MHGRLSCTAWHQMILLTQEPLPPCVYPHHKASLTQHLKLSTEGAASQFRTCTPARSENNVTKIPRSLKGTLSGSETTTLRLSPRAATRKNLETARTFLPWSTSAETTIPATSDSCFSKTDVTFPSDERFVLNAPCGVLYSYPAAHCVIAATQLSHTCGLDSDIDDLCLGGSERSRHGTGRERAPWTRGWLSQRRTRCQKSGCP